MGEVPKDRVRAPFLAVGDWNGNVKILGLSPENLLEQVRTASWSMLRRLRQVLGPTGDPLV